MPGIGSHSNTALYCRVYVNDNVPNTFYTSTGLHNLGRVHTRAVLVQLGRYEAASV